MNINNKPISKEQLLYCLEKGYGEHRACRYLGIGPATYRRHMKNHGLKTDHKMFDNKGWHKSLPICPECNNHKCIAENKICSHCLDTIRTRALKQFLVNISGGKCVKCGETRLDILEFHHLDKDGKDFNILHGHITKKKIKLYLDEIKKCCIMCCRCHKLEHTKQFTTEIAKQNLLEELEKLSCQHK